jgi:hypothetical protein
MRHGAIPEQTMNIVKVRASSAGRERAKFIFVQFVGTNSALQRPVAGLAASGENQCLVGVI